MPFNNPYFPLQFDVGNIGGDHLHFDSNGITFENSTGTTIYYRLGAQVSQWFATNATLTIAPGGAGFAQANPSIGWQLAGHNTAGLIVGTTVANDLNDLLPALLIGSPSDSNTSARSLLTLAGITSTAAHDAAFGSLSPDVNNAINAYGASSLGGSYTGKQNLIELMANGVIAKWTGTDMSLPSTGRFVVSNAVAISALAAGGQVFIASQSTNDPATNAGGGTLYVLNGSLHYRGAGGTLTAIAPS